MGYTDTLMVIINSDSVKDSEEETDSF